MNQTEFWTVPQLSGVEFFLARYIDFSYAPHFHEDYAMGVVESGIHAFRYRRENFAIPPQHIVTCQPGEVHNGHPGNQAPWHYRMLYLAPSVVCQLAAEMGHSSTSLPFLNHTAIGHPQLVQAVRRFHVEAYLGEPTLSLEIQLQEILVIMLNHYSEIRGDVRQSVDEHSPIAKVKAYLHDHYTDDIQLNDLVGVAHLSKSYLIRSFRRHEGISPYAYLVSLRLNHAKRLLSEGIAASNVAHQTGFFDQSHLTRSFKRFLGTTPGRYQQAIG